MPIKLNSSGGGSVTVDAPVTASNLTVTLPSSNGTIATTDGTNTTFTSITDSGNLTFTGTGNRITGDFSNATVANRVLFQTSTTNANTQVSAIPNGTGSASNFYFYRSSDPTNTEYARIGASSGNVVILESGITGTGTYLPMTFYTGGSERMRIDTSGNVGIGNTNPAVKLEVSGSITMRATGAALYFRNAGATAYPAYITATDSTDFTLSANQAIPMVFKTSDTERMRIDTSGNLLVGTTSAATPSATGFVSCANTFGFKNRIINGAMVINQRNNPGPLSSTESYTLDRWSGIDTTSGGLYITQEPSNVPSGFIRAIRSFTTSQATSITGSEYAWIGQKIEGYNTADLAFGTSSAHPITLSFWVRSSLTGTFSGAIQNIDGTRSYVFSYTISSADTWENKSITISGDTTGTWNGFNATGLQVLFSLGAASGYCTSSGSWNAGTYYAATGQVNVVSTLGSSFYITGVQLEKGTAATSFDFRPYTTELQLCQRYYFKYLLETTGGRWGVGFCSATTAARVTIPFPVTMRIAPTALEQTGTATDYSLINASGGAVNCSSVPIWGLGSNQNADVTFTVASGMVAGNATQGRSNAAGAYLAWSAEL